MDYTLTRLNFIAKGIKDSYEPSGAQQLRAGLGSWTGERALGMEVGRGAGGAKPDGDLNKEKMAVSLPNETSLSQASPNFLITNCRAPALAFSISCCSEALSTSPPQPHLYSSLFSSRHTPVFQAHSIFLQWYHPRHSGSCNTPWIGKDQ